jgi:hypothetical protein
MENYKPKSIEEHLAVIDQVKAEAMALDADGFSAPDIPVKIYLDELRTSVLAARQYFDALDAVGYTAPMLARLDQLLEALTSVQAVWNTERRGGRSEAVADLIEAGEAEREEHLSAADLALRHDDAGLERIGLIREGEGLADLTADLGDLALLMTDFRDAFKAIKVDAKAAAGSAVSMQKRLQQALAEERVGKSLKGYKELRDRIWALSKFELSELRAFSTRAFRKDKTNARRHLFTSTYTRRRDQRARRKRAEAQATSGAQAQ